eukprot:scaffold7064_cov111-Cylindrotheca_fusiformis.AAC.11
MQEQDEDGGGTGMGDKSEGAFARNESLDATTPPRPSLARRNENQNTDPGAVPMGGDSSPQTSDRTIQVGDMGDDDPSDMVMNGFLVDESQQQYVPSMLQETVTAVAMSEEGVRPSGTWLMSRNRQVCLVVVLLVIVAASLTAGLLPSDGSNDLSDGSNDLSDGSNDTDFTVPPTATPTLSISMLADLLRDSVEDPTPWEDTTTPQYRALEWLVTEDLWTAARMEGGKLNIPLQVLVERYVLVFLYFAWNGLKALPWDPDVKADTWMLLANQSSCDWNANSDCFNEYSEPFGAVCNDSFVTGLSLRKSSVLPAASTSGHQVVGASGGIPTELMLLTSLEYLLLAGNGLAYEIPPELFQLPKLEFLSLRDNFLTGYIPPEAGLATNLRKLDLGSNSLKGPLDNVVNPRLQQLDLSDSYVAGTIPADFGKMTLLERLDLTDTKISGSLPSTLANMHRLKYLSLSRTLSTGVTVSGAVPETVSGMNLSYLYLEQTGLSNLDAFCSNLNLENFTADCGGCSCCTSCCDVGIGNCTYWGAPHMPFQECR